MWKSLGFMENPYDVKPLKVDKNDVEMLIGREDKGIEFFTSIESGNEGIVVISGMPGVGKTSFFNVQQYKIENVGLIDNSKYLSARILCPIQPSDDPRAIAERIVYTYTKSIIEYCNITKKSIPSKVKGINNWISNKNDSSFDVGLQIAGFGGNLGRSVSLPSIKDSTFENIQDAIELLTDSVVNELHFSGAFICLDNIENIENAQLSALLMSLRDTLFSIKCIWWILIGQSGLATLIQTIDKRVSDRITGSGFELSSITCDEMIEAINKRIERFHDKKKRAILMNADIYKHLYAASGGELRFIFKYCNSIFMSLVNKIKQGLVKKHKEINEEVVSALLGGAMIENEIPKGVAEAQLKEIIGNEIEKLELRAKDIKIINYLNINGTIRPSEYEKIGFKSMQDFYTNYLKHLLDKDLLVKEQIGKEVKYRLRGLSYLATEYNLLSTHHIDATPKD